MNRCDYKKALQLIIRTEAVEMKTKVYLEYNKVLFTYNASWVFFICGEFRESLKRINYILNSTDVSEKNYYIPKLARLLQLILFFELKEYTTLGHRIRSLYRYLLKYKKLYPFEKILLNFIRNTLQKSTFYDSSTVKKMFSGLLETLEKTYRENPDKKSIGYDDFINWLESKIQNRPFADVVREKAMAEKGNSISTD